MKPCSGCGCIGPLEVHFHKSCKCKEGVSSNKSDANDGKASFRHISLMYPAKSCERIQGRGEALEAEVAGSLS